MTSRNACFPAIDVMRGFVMVLMTIVHASETFNRVRAFTDRSYKASHPTSLARFV